MKTEAKRIYLYCIYGTQPGQEKREVVFGATRRDADKLMKRLHPSDRFRRIGFISFQKFLDVWYADPNVPVYTIDVDVNNPHYIHVEL